MQREKESIDSFDLLSKCKCANTTNTTTQTLTTFDKKEQGVVMNLKEKT